MTWRSPSLPLFRATRWLVNTAPIPLVPVCRGCQAGPVKWHPPLDPSDMCYPGITAPSFTAVAQHQRVLPAKKRNKWKLVRGALTSCLKSIDLLDPPMLSAGNSLSRPEPGTGTSPQASMPRAGSRVGAEGGWPSPASSSLSTLGKGANVGGHLP